MASGENFKATMICSRPENGTAFVFDWGYTDPSGSAHIDTGTAAGNFQTLVQAKMQAVLSTFIRIERYRFACVNGTHKGEVGFVNGTGIMGLYTGAGNPLPQEICISMKRNTGHVSRRDRGRLFFGPCWTDFGDGLQQDGVDVANTDLLDVCNLGKADLTTGATTLRPVILSGDGTSTGNFIVNTSIASIFVHRKSRRMRAGI